MRVRLGHWRALFALLALAPVLVSARPDGLPVAVLDRQEMRLGETVSLQVTAEGQNPASPDFSVLEADFELLGRSTSSQLSLVAGQSVARTTWTIELEPRRAGILRIPPLAVGTAATAPLTLTVTEAPGGASGDAEDIVLEMEITPRQPYVHQPVQLVLRLLYAVALTEGNLREPEVTGAALTRVGQDRSYAADRHGRRYQVVERVFSLRPERSGELIVGAAEFRGRALRPTARRSLMDPGLRVSARAAAERLTVRPRPASFHGDWLPARSLHVEDEVLTGATGARVGEPLTRVVRLYAEGLGLDQMPDLEHPALAGVQVYPDRPIGHGRETGGWLSAEREYRFALVPERAGELELPELRIPWWDVIADQAREAVLPARRVPVAAAPGSPALALVPDASAEAEGADTATDTGLWRAASLALGLLWLLTVAVWWYSARRVRLPPAAAGAVAPDLARLRFAFQRAVATADAGAALTALLAWARALDPRVTGMAALRRRLRDAAQCQALAAFERARYGRAGDVPDRVWRELREAFADGPDLRCADAPREDALGLASLWPERP
jgi:hypothetical protein